METSHCMDCGPRKEQQVAVKWGGHPPAQQVLPGGPQALCLLHEMRKKQRHDKTRAVGRALKVGQDSDVLR